MLGLGVINAKRSLPERNSWGDGQASDKRKSSTFRSVDDRPRCVLKIRKECSAREEDAKDKVFQMARFSSWIRFLPETATQQKKKEFFRRVLQFSNCTT